MFTFLAICYCLSCVIMGYFGERKGYDYWKAFLLNYLLTPLVFMVFMVVDKYLDDVKTDK